MTPFLYFDRIEDKHVRKYNACAIAYNSLLKVLHENYPDYRTFPHSICVNLHALEHECGMYSFFVFANEKGIKVSNKEYYE